MAHHGRTLSLFRPPWHDDGPPVRSALHMYSPHLIFTSPIERLVLWLFRDVFRIRARGMAVGPVLKLQLLDLFLGIVFLFAVLRSWIGINGHAEPADSATTAALLLIASTRFVTHIIVRMRSSVADETFHEDPVVEFVTKACDATTIAEAVYFLSSFLRMKPATAFSFLIALLNYHQIRVWRSQFKKNQGAALWLGGLTWEFLMLLLVACLALVFPQDGQALEDFKLVSYGWHAHLQNQFDEYEWLTGLSILLVGFVSFFVRAFQAVTTTVDIFLMLRAIENEPGLRRKSAHHTVVRLFLVAVVPNLVFNGAVDFWVSTVLGPQCQRPASAITFVMIFFGHTATVLQIMYDRITRGPYGLLYISDIVVCGCCAVWYLTCFPAEAIAACASLFVFFWVWFSGVLVLSVREVAL